MTVEKDSVSEAGLLEQIVTASSILEQQSRQSNKIYPEQRDESEGESDDDGSEVFEDGDEEDDEEIELSEAEEGQNNLKRDEGIPASVAAVLTELSQVTTTTTTITTPPNASSATKIDSIIDKPVSGAAAIGGLLNDHLSKGFTRSPNMTATINSINAILQSQLSSHHAGQMPQKVRLSGPIRANVNIRHGVWAPRLRCRKRKNLHAKDGIWIHPSCSLEQLISLVKDVLPDEFEWDPQSSPLRYQAVNDQSLQSLKTVSGTVAAGQSLYAAFDLVRNRRSDGDNFVLQLYVYGTWTVLLKQTNTGMHHAMEEESVSINNMSILQPPPKKKYQQAHYSQQQQQQLQQQADEPIMNHSSMFSHMRLTTNNSNNTSNAINNNNTIPLNNGNNNYCYPPHPLTANPPVTFLPTVTLEMKLNGTFVPVEISKRSFMTAIRACSIPRVNSKDDPINNNTNNNTNNNNNIESSSSNTTGSNPANITPPPSDI